MFVVKDVSAIGRLPKGVLAVIAALVVDVPDFVTVQLHVRSFLQAMNKTTTDP